MLVETAIHERIGNTIYVIRNQKVMLDSDLAVLYGIDTKRINEQVRRNRDRFPEDFMFQLTSKEWTNLKSQFATSSWGGRRNLPYMFTEQGIAMLSSVINSPTAIQVNIAIMRVFVQMRQWALNHDDLLKKIDMLSQTQGEQGAEIQYIMRVMESLVSVPSSDRKLIGFNRSNE